MGFKCGIVGMPNVGKSTLFNALIQSVAAETANYPFCTIDPNIGEISVPDLRLQKLAEISKSAQSIPARLTFVDIAGLVRGASSGEGLGNKFLAHIREVDAIIYVLRCFDDDEITHTEGRVEPAEDADIVETELMLADLESLEKRCSALEKKVKANDKEAKSTLALINKALDLLRDGKPASEAELSAEEEGPWQRLQLLTSKPVLYVCNVDEDSAITGNVYTDQIKNRSTLKRANYLIISAKIEAELALLEEAERKDFLEAIGLQEPGLNRLIRSGYKLLGLITFFTVGPKEARAWTVVSGTKAPQAAGAIHTDFEKGFIRAEIIKYEDYVNKIGEAACKEQGRMRLEGKDYMIKDGDIVHFRFAN
ncbi:MAG: redox-regulated ATPase YchF [Hyphomicrobiaceae bacterium]|nr:redox-regulated ATPase YchF [Hyphomicrobiaceae bacterium]